MKTDKRPKIKLKMEQLEKELLHVKQEPVKYCNGVTQYTDKCAVLENEAKNTVFHDQMELYASIQKDTSKPNSHKLNNIAHKEMQHILLSWKNKLHSSR